MAAVENISGLSLGTGIEYSWTVQQLGESSGVPDDRYFYDFQTKLVYYKNSSGVTIKIFEEGGAGSGTDSDAIHKNIDSEISTINEKTSLADDDLFVIEDSASSNDKKSIKMSTIKEEIGNTGTPGVSQSIQAFSIADITQQSVLNDAGTVFAVKVIPTVKRVVTQMSYLVTSANVVASIKVGIYNGTYGGTYAKLGGGINTSGGASTVGVKSIALQSPVTLQADTEYYFAFYDQHGSANYGMKATYNPSTPIISSARYRGAHTGQMDSTLWITTTSGAAKTIWLKAY
jgi:hypothetical protein